MAEIKEITNIEENFAKWYTDVVIKADLISYSSVKGCMIIRPYGYAIWENIQNELNKEFKKTGHENIYMPLLIPESLLNKEKEHVKGFAPEVAWVTHGGNELLTERFCIRPTSETLFCEHFKDIVKSYRDLPKKYNQWCNVVRWEKTTRPFLRSREFLWQEGHTIHETEKEARTETINMLNIYGDFCENILAMPVIRGEKTPKEKFAGAENTYTIEALMHNGIALQSGTSHYFGQHFTEAFDITYSDRFNEVKHPYQTSWGVSTRLIGGIIMTHGDNNGLVLPPLIAPIKVCIVPIKNDSSIIKIAKKIQQKLEKSGIVTTMDDSDKSVGFKFAETEVKGIPIRLEIGPKDIENDKCILARRDTLEKMAVDLKMVVKEIKQLLEDIQNNLFYRAVNRRDSSIFNAKSMDELASIFKERNGFVRGLWCGDIHCEEKIKEELSVTSRCIPFNDSSSQGKCVCCGKDANTLVYWGKQY